METKTPPIAKSAEKKNLREASLEARHKKQPFPPRRDYASLSIKDLLDAREAYHVHLSSLENVLATAIGRYRIHENDWYATHAPDHLRPHDVAPITAERTLATSVVKPWSWPSVLVFVKKWDHDANSEIPRTLYLPDGRSVPTCVILAPPDDKLPVMAPTTHASPLLGGGYPCQRRHQGETALGTFGCLVKKDGTYYALTSRHVAGSANAIVKTTIHGDTHRVGKTSGIGVGRVLMSDIFQSWPGHRTYLNLDAGLVKIDRIDDWTAQVFGIGEVGEVFDATEAMLTLDMIGCPVRAFGGASGVVEGEIHALFFRYESLGGYDHVSDVLIGPQHGKKDKIGIPFTQPGDSGTLWFYDPSSHAPVNPHDDVETPVAPERGLRARRLHPIAMQWGGERIVEPNGDVSAYALGSFLSTILACLDAQIVRDWSTGHDEYWGKLGHFAIGYKACDQLGAGKLATLMKKNQARIGYGNESLKLGSEFRTGRNDFYPLADVPDYVWINSRGSEGPQHFADIDIYDINGGKSLLDRGLADPKTIAASVWKEVFDGFAEKKVGPDEGCLPFRIWQLFDAMVDFLKKDKDVIRFVAAAGVLAHYVGDASQPLHCSYLHHGRLPMIKVGKRKYPIPKHLAGTAGNTPEYDAWEKTKEAKIHSIYEEMMLEQKTLDALQAVDAKLGTHVAKGTKIKRGHDAANATIQLMGSVRKRLSPDDIIDADDISLNQPDRAARLWANKKVREATVASLADSVTLLADLWAAAWREGNGDAIAATKLITFTEADLRTIYKDAKFVPSLTLTRMVESKKFEP